jgi:predicted permease
MLDTWIQDARFAVRLLRQSPLFTITAALSLAIGIGANATIFSVASALLLRPMLGLAESERLVDIGRTQDGDGFDTVSYPNYRDFKERTKLLDDVFAIRLKPLPMSLGGPDGAERVYGTTASANFFTVLGTKPHLGRLLQGDDDDAGGRLVAVITHDLWLRRYGADPSIAGRSILLNAHPFTIVGVAPRGFQGTTVLKPDLWVPISAVAQATPRSSADLLTSRQSVWLFMGGRLKQDVSLVQANAEAAAIGAALEREYPQQNRGKSFTIASTALVPGRTGMLAGFIGLLMGIVGLVLLIACVNVVGMLLARATERRREIAVRLALGAGRRRLVRQLLTETVMLFAVGAVVGLLLSRWLTSLLLAVLPQLPVPLALEISTDWRVVSFATVVSFVAAILSGLAPALQASRADLVPALKAEALDGGTYRLRLRNAFVVGQITMSLILLVTGGLFLRALQHAASIDPGFDQNNVEVVALDLSLAGLTRETGGSFLRELLERIRETQEVDSVSAAVDLPLDGGRFGMGAVRVPGRDLPSGRDSLSDDWNVIEPGYFRTLRLPLTRGREFTTEDRTGSQPVAIINEAFARQAWPGEDPLGRQLEMQGESGRILLTVVGVTADAKLVSLSGPVNPFIYLPMAQHYMSRTQLLIRSADGRSTLRQVRALLREMNPNLPVTEALPLRDVTAVGVIPQRIAAAVAASLGAVALLLAAIGIFGVTSHAASRRTREIGIRMALGADRSSVKALILKQGFTLAGIGIATGLALSAIGSRLLESLLFGIPPLDPVTFAGAAALFAGVTLAASYFPARRATNVDPMVALRNE